jgi:hypothetical protein
MCNTELSTAALPQFGGFTDVEEELHWQANMHHAGLAVNS